MGRLDSAPGSECAEPSSDAASLEKENAALRAQIASLLVTAEAVKDAMVVDAGAQGKLSDYFLQAPFALGVLRGPEHRIQVANPAVLSIWGKDPSVVGLPLGDAVPESRPFLGYLDDVFRTGETFEGKGLFYQLELPDGSFRDFYFDIVYSALRSRDGVVEGILFLAIDVSERVAAERQRDALRAEVLAQERYFQDVVNNMPQLAWTARADGTLDYVNQRWIDYSGRTVEIINATPYDPNFYHPDDVAEVARMWKHSIATGEPFEREFRMRGLDGNLRWFLTRIRPLHDANGKVVRWFGTNVDIDDRHKAEGFRETFLAVLGHDLRNPLTTILTTSRLLRMRKNMPSDHHPQLDRVVRSGTRMERMISQLLDITRARLAGGIPVHRSLEPIDVAALVSRIVDETRGANPTRAIDLTVHGECFARIDADRCEQVVSNLIGNAITHGDPSAPVQVELSRVDDGAPVLRLSVRNQGNPIPRAILPHLFSPFVRAEKPEGPSAGLGLGLYISERIVAAHGGSLLVHSDAESGTRFDVVIPTLPAAPASSRP